MYICIEIFNSITFFNKYRFVYVILHEPTTVLLTFFSQRDVDNFTFSCHHILQGTKTQGGQIIFIFQIRRVWRIIVAFTTVIKSSNYLLKQTQA